MPEKTGNKPSIKTGKPLQELPEGSNILFYSERESQWLPGVIVQRTT